MRAMLTLSRTMDSDSTQTYLLTSSPELATRAIEASGVSSTPLVAETTDGVTHEIMRLTPTNP